MNEDLTYNKAIAELDEIIRKIENEQISLEKLPEILQRAKFLVDYCQSIIYASKDMLEKFVSEEKTNTNDDYFRNLDSEDNDDNNPF